MKLPLKKSLIYLTLGLSISACTRPPYYDFDSDRKTAKATLIGAGVGTIVGAASGNTLAGTVIGSATGALIGTYKESPRRLERQLGLYGMQVVHYGDTTTVLVPTDLYYHIDTSHLNELKYPGLNTLAKYIHATGTGPIYVAAFTDDVGSKKHKRLLTQAQAETMLTFLWANHISASRLSAEGYLDSYEIANNKTIRGSAMNRRVEVQWHTNIARKSIKDYLPKMKG